MNESRTYRLADASRLRVEAGAVEPPFDESKYSLGPGLTLKKPFRTLSSGHVTSRFDGEPVTQYISAHILEELARVFHERLNEDPVVIDWNHGSSPNWIGVAGDPAGEGAMGVLVDAFVFDDGTRGPGLYVVPAYNADGLKVLAANEGALWSSPEFRVGPCYAREARGKKLGDAQLLAVALTPRPAQSATVIDRVTLSEGSGPGHTPAQEAPVKTLHAALLAGLALAESAPEITTEDREAFKRLSEKLGVSDQPSAEAPVQAPVQAAGEPPLGEAERALLSAAGIEAESLKGAVIKLAEKLKVQAQEASEAKAKALLSEATAVVNGMVNIGRIPPFQRKAAEQAYRENRNLFNELFGQVPPHAALDLRPALGHEAPGDDSGPDVVAEVEKYSEANGLTFNDAMRKLAAERPELFVER